MIEVIQNEGGNWQCVVNGFIQVECPSKSVCLRQARLFEHCRNVSYRAAIKLLMDEIGYSEMEAKDVYIEITEHRSTSIN